MIVTYFNYPKPPSYLFLYFIFVAQCQEKFDLSSFKVFFFNPSMKLIQGLETGITRIFFQVELLEIFKLLTLLIINQEKNNMG